MPIPPRYPTLHYRPGEVFDLADGRKAELVVFKEFAYNFAREVWLAKIYSRFTGEPAGFNLPVSLVRPAHLRR